MKRTNSYEAGDGVSSCETLRKCSGLFDLGKAIPLPLIYLLMFKFR